MNDAMLSKVTTQPLLKSTQEMRIGLSFQIKHSYPISPWELRALAYRAERSLSGHRGCVN